MAGKGRPTDYKPEYPEQAAKLCDLGATDIEIADFFKVNVSTINRWKITYPDFCASIRVAKQNADERIERSLYQRGLGYSHDAVKIFMPAGALEPVYASYQEHYPPDTAAAIFWLKNRRKDEWKDKQEVEHSGSVDIVTKEQRDAATEAFIRSQS